MSSLSSLRPPDRRGGIYRWFVLGLLGAIYFTAFADRLALSLLVEPIKHDLRISDSQIGLLFGLSFAAALAVTSLPIARLADRGNRRNLISACVAIWSLMTAASGLAGSFAALLACRVGLAVGEAGLTPAALSLIADMFGARHRSLALSIYLTAGIAGAAGSLVVVGAVVQWASGHSLHLPGLGALAPWRLTLVLIGVSSIGLAALVRLTVREPIRAPGAAKAGVWEALGFLRSRARSYVGYFVAGAMLALMSISASAWYPTLLIRERGISAGEVGYLFGAVSLVAGVSGSLVVPIVVSALSRWKPDSARLVTLTAVAIGSPCYILASLASDLSISLTSMGLALFCFIGAINVPAVAIQHAAPGHLRAQLAALYFLGVNVGGLGVGPLLTARIASAFGGEHDIAPALAVIGLVCGPTALLALLTVPRARLAET